MKTFKYTTLIALMIFNGPLLAMNAPQQGQANVTDSKLSSEEKQAIAIINKNIGERRAKIGKGPGIKVFGSYENPIPLTNKRLADDLTKLLNTYQPLREIHP